MNLSRGIIKSSEITNVPPVWILDDNTGGTAVSAVYNMNGRDARSPSLNGRDARSPSLPHFHMLPKFEMIESANAERSG